MTNYIDGNLKNCSDLSSSFLNRGKGHIIIDVVFIDGDMTRKTVVVIGFVLVDNNDDNGGNNEENNDAGSVDVVHIVMIMRLYT